MATERHVRLFKNGRNQALRIPREFELPGNEAIVREFELPGNEAIVHKEGDRLIVEPVRRHSLLALLATWEPLEENFPDIQDRPPEPVDL